MCTEDYKPFVHETMNAESLLKRTIETRNRRVIFRGVKDSEYKLMPSAFRDEGKEKLRLISEQYLTNEGLGSFSNLLTRDRRELLSLECFYSLANQQGISIPDIPHQYHGDPYAELVYLEYNEEEWMCLDKWVELAALAQHYGVPTRLLDWTFDMNVAIYFAVKGLNDEILKSQPDKMISIWELDKSLTSMLTPDVRFIVPKYNGNPNLHAQSGILSINAGIYNGIEIALEDLIQREWNGSEDIKLKKMISETNTPILRKIDIKYNEINKLKRNFESRGLRYDHFFPGLEGVVKTMKDMAGIIEK